MIIKATCLHDNDFSNFIYQFFSNLPSHICEDLEEKTQVNKEESNLTDLNNAWRQYRETLNHYVEIYQKDEWSKEDKEWLEDRIRKSIFTFTKHFVRDLPAYYNLDPEDQATYLRDNLEISFIKSFKDEWENGEVVYWFQHSNKAIVQ